MKTQNSSIKTQNAEILSKLRIYESVGGSELQILFTFNIFPVAVTVFALMIKGHLCVTIQTIQTHGLWWHWGEDQPVVQAKRCISLKISKIIVSGITRVMHIV